MKQVLGTAQFGLDNYGIGNFSRKKKLSEKLLILEESYKMGINFFDTAPGYNSEKIVGKFLKMNNLQSKINIITKIPKLNPGLNIIDQVKKSIDNSYENLKINNIYCLLVHNENDINIISKNYKFLENLKKNFNINNFGFSVYDIKVANRILNFFPDASLQFPYNILNSSFKNIKKNNNLFFARSVFCQGLLIRKKIKNFNHKLIISHKNYLKYIDKNKIDPVELCLDYVFQQKNIDFIVYGINSIKELKKNISYIPKNNIKKKTIKEIKFIFKNNDVNPRNWSY